MNILEVQDKLKGLSDQQLAQEMQMPTGTAPQFLVLSELQRRKRVRDQYAGQQAQAPTTTVAEEAIAAAGMPQAAASQMAQTLAPQTSVAQNTGIASLPVQAAEPQKMAEGGVVKMAEGRIVRGGVIYELQPDGTYLGENGRRILSAGQDLTRLFEGQGTAAPPPDDGLTWGQRNIGAPLREVFAPVGDALRGVGQPVGDALRSAGDYVMENSPRFILGPIPAESSAPPEAPPPADTTPSRDMEALDARNALLGNLVEYYDEQGRADAAPSAPEAPREPFQEDFGMPIPHPDDPPLPGVLERIFGADALERAGFETTRTPRDDREVMGPPMPDKEQQAEMDRLREENEKAAAAAADTPVVTAPVGGGAGGAGGAGGSGGIALPAEGGGGADYEKAIADAIARADKRAEQDKWLALAQAGMALMSSKQPTFGGALGEAGMVGLGQFRSGRDAAEKDKLGLMQTQYEIDMAKQEMALKRAALAARGSGGARGSVLTANQRLKAASDRVRDAADMLESVRLGGTEQQKLDAKYRYDAAMTEYDYVYRMLTGVEGGYAPTEEEIEDVPQ